MKSMAIRSSLSYAFRNELIVFQPLTTEHKKSLRQDILSSYSIKGVH